MIRILKLPDTYFWRYEQLWSTLGHSGSILILLLQRAKFNHRLFRTVPTEMAVVDLVTLLRLKRPRKTSRIYFKHAEDIKK